MGFESSPSRTFHGTSTCFLKQKESEELPTRDSGKKGCVPLPEWTGMDIITGMDYRNGHSAMALGALDMFYLHKMYFCSHMNSLHEIKFISVEQS